MSSKVSSRAEAKASVEAIRRSHGYLDEHVLNLMESDVRQTVEASLMKKSEIGDAVDALVKNLEKNDGSFVFELLRNADDNRFTKARDRGTFPFVRFTIAPSYITVHCNEDGFTTEDLRAICAIGKSSKVDRPECFGEDGVGFKSVFTVAYKVHIRSGHYSFSFNHQRGQSGMGMFSPTWEKSGDGPPTIHTWIILFLHLDILQDTDNPIMKQFERIQEKHLLFLRNLERIEIIQVDSRGATISTQKYSIRRDTVHIMTISGEKDGVKNEEKNYYVTKFLREIPRNKSGTHSRLKTTAENELSLSEVILAFPLDSTHSNPVVDNQEVFAFSPIGTMGFKFLIQADFELQPSSQTLDTISSRNHALLDSIATAFVQAIGFCNLDLADRLTMGNLDAKWMRYLPQKNDHPWDGYWKELYEHIKAKVETTPLVRRLNGFFSYKIKETRRFGPLATDSNGDPIFEDAYPLSYLSKIYEESDLDYLTEYGLEWISHADVLTFASNDLKKPESRMKSPKTSDQWHTAAAEFLGLSFEKGWEMYVRNMEVIPLANGKWISAASATTPLSFTSTNGLEIPQDLPLTFINPSANHNAARAAFFRQLGTEDLSISYIRQLIFDKYPVVTEDNPAIPSTIPIITLLEHLEFLYLSHTNNDASDEGYERIAVLTEAGTLRKPLSVDVYMPDTHRYGVKQLLKPTTSAQPPDVAILSHIYFLRRKEDAWAEWLQTTLGIRTQPRLIHENEPTDIFRYVMEHRNDELVGVLRHYWPEISKGVEQSRPLLNQISRSSAFCMNGLVQLNHTYLPLPKLMALSSRFLESTMPFPFLDLSNTLEPNAPSTWEFLTKIGVGNAVNAFFFLDMLAYFRKYDILGKYGQSTPIKAFAMYPLIHEGLARVANIGSVEAYCRMTFRNSSLILLPIEGNGCDRWKATDGCRWDCPVNMKSLSGIRSYYTSLFEETVLLGEIMPLMRNVVGVSELSSEDILNELAVQKKEKNPDEDLIRKLYAWLADMVSASSESDKSSLKEAFRTDPLIFAAGAWYTAQACVWSSATDLLSKTDLSCHYPDMETAFVTVLGVSRMTLDAAYEELQLKGTSDSTTIDEIKAELWQFNSLLPDARNKPDPSPILDSRVFPVKSPHGSVQLVSAASTDFAVIDRKSLEEKFRGLAKMLDFNLNEVRRLQPFLRWAGLDERRLSVKVTEVITQVEVANANEEALEELRRSFESKVYALCRIAAHFGSPKAEDPESLRKTLKTFEFIGASSMKSELHLEEGGRTLKTDQQEAALYLNFTDRDFDIFVPYDAYRRDICLRYDLPHALFKWMMDGSLPTLEIIEVQAAKRLIANILNDEPASVETLLDREGIVELDIPGDPLANDDRPLRAEQSPEAPIPIPIGYLVLPEPPTPSRLYNPPDEDEISFSSSSSSLAGPFTSHQPASTSPLFPLTHLISHSLPGSSSEPSTPLLPSSTETPEVSIPRVPTYVALLDMVIRVARVVGLPHRGYDMSAMREALLEIDDDGFAGQYFRHPSSEGPDFARMMGAAGELFVFEILSNLNPQLPGFSRSCWRSTIRRFIIEHPDYSNMSEWVGWETSDIVYTDSTGALTAAFIHHGYLSEEKWGGRKLRYYIEVKTTTAPSQRPFFMGSPQYSRIHEIGSKGTDDEGHEAIYVIFRVFHLGTTSMNYELYFEPHLLELSGALIFDTTNGTRWEVYPG
ncbi:hypothetical protein F5Y10DRAFT_231100 [Nemania abortiva]|nr:hypothetical protein F5Y10DRAFT_231100 [Nemania abortiva]